VTTTQTVTATATVTVPPPNSPAGDTTQPSGQPSGPAPLPTGEVNLSDLTPLGIAPEGHFEIRSVTMGGKVHSGAMALRYPCQSGFEYSINQRYKRLTFTAGLDDNGVAEPGQLAVIGDGKVLKKVFLEINKPQTVTLDISGVVRLSFDPEFGDASSCGAEGVVVAIGGAVLKG
jgi:hypothetical protein